MKINLDEIKFKIKFLEGKKVKAIVALDFGEFVVRGFRVMESNYKNMNDELLWFTPPTYMGGGRHHPIFFLLNKEQWQELEKMFWKEYETQKNEHFRKRMQVSDEEWNSIS